ncbi:NADH dehydrogenase [ubiquinone] flavoprotein 3, mitochondrial [Thomomys bottae]
MGCGTRWWWRHYVVQAKERGRPRASHTATAPAANLSPPGSPTTAGSKGLVAPSLRLAGSARLTEEGLPRPPSRKTLVEFPQKVPSPLGEQGSDSSSSSSSSSDSDSESDEERLASEAAPQVVSKGQKGFPKPEASHSSKNRAPKITGSTKEETKTQRPQTHATDPEQPLQPRKKGPLGTKAMPTPRPPADEEVLKQNLKEEQLQKRFGSSKTEKTSQKPHEVKEISPDHVQRRLSAALSPEATSQMEETEPTRQLPTTASGTQGRHLKPKETVPGQEAREENVGKLETGLPEAREKAGVARVPPGSSQAGLVQEVFGEKPAAPRLQGGPQETVGTDPPTEDATQGPAQAEFTPEPPEPFDNTTYRNLQHHDYNAYTFLDVNLDLSQFRLPQPTSGRKSPRH